MFENFQDVLYMYLSRVTRKRERVNLSPGALCSSGRPAFSITNTLESEVGRERTKERKSWRKGNNEGNVK